MKKRKNIIALSILVVIFIGISIYVRFDTPGSYEPENNAAILLYGETHGSEAFYDIEFSAWKECYENENMRDLFLELPYYTAEFLNIWMQEDNDDILLQIYDDIENTQSHVPEYLDFFRRIKEECPETVFYGTDVGHCYDTTGIRYIAYLEENHMEESEQYDIAMENIGQGREWYQKQDPIDWDWREEKMVANFIRAYDGTGHEKIMGIYGSAHIELEDPNIMAGALKEHYGDIISCVNVYTELVSQKSYCFGFSYIGLIFLLMLFIPNMLWTKHQPKDYQIYAKNENRLLLIFERIGEALATVVSLIFKDFNLLIYKVDYGVIVPARIGYLVFAFVLMFAYELYWIRYFKSEKRMEDFYSDFAGVPLAGATLPVMAFALLGVYGNNVIMLIAAAILGIGHIGIHRQHYKEVCAKSVEA